MTRSERATTLEWLEAVMIANELQGDTDGCDEEVMVYKAVSGNRYLERNHVECCRSDTPREVTNKLLDAKGKYED
ncbi:hypothetical protein GN958_ATG09661 [Phytophthora infestans]|uniref:Uncharacterized protein n=1 Tax=Phytophthora infestans TaxID=4787 RepID=A0A8S9UKU0_PHYIN|nr:hypothetical protein GN958_ATG09661 [Phytophthora infestans]